MRLICPQEGQVTAFVVERLTVVTAPESTAVVFITPLFILNCIAQKIVFKPLDLGIGRHYSLNQANLP